MADRNVLSNILVQKSAECGFGRKLYSVELKDNVISSVAYNHVVEFFIDADWTFGRDSRP